MAVQDTLSSLTPNISVSGTVSTISFILYLVIFFAVFGVIFYFISQRLKFKYKVIIWEKVNGVMTITGRDRGMEFKVGESGDTAFKLLKRKKIVPMPTIQTGKNTYWFAIRSDREWLNIGIADINETSKRLELDLTDPEMRYARTSLQGNLKERLVAKEFWEQYGQMIMSISFIAIIGIMMWLIMDKWLELSQTLNGAIAQVPQILDRMETLTVAMDNMCSGGSGFAPATT